MTNKCMNMRIFQLLMICKQYLWDPLKTQNVLIKQNTQFKQTLSSRVTISTAFATICLYNLL